MARLLRLPRGFPAFTVPANPNPSRVTAEMWEFYHAVLALEPGDFEASGTYVRKSGYHATVADNLASWPGSYSVRLLADLNGVRDKGRGVDVSSRSAKVGNFTIMAKYGARMRAAARAKSPRVRHWREVLGQFDADKPPEAIDFQSIVERQPDDTHSWHFHWSVLAAFVGLALAYEGMLSVLFGESEADFAARTSPDAEDEEDMGKPILCREEAGGVATNPTRYILVCEGSAFPVPVADAIHARYALRQRGMELADGADGAEWFHVGPAKDPIPVRHGWAPYFGGGLPLDQGALITALVTALDALDLELADEDVDRVVAALKSASDVPLDEDDQPAIERALRAVLREAGAEPTT